MDEDTGRAFRKPVVAPNHMQNASNVSGMNFFSYVTAHALTDVLAPGYFNLMRGGLERFDRIEITASAEREPEHATLIVTDASPSGGATVEVLRGPGGE